MHRKKCLYLLSLSLTLAVAFGLSSPGWAAAPAAAGDRLTVSGTFKNPSNKGVKEVEVEVLVDGKHVKPEGKDEEIVTGKQGTFMREFVLPAGTLPAAKVEVAAKKPNWEPLKPTAVSLVDAGADAQGNRVFQAASTFLLKRAVTPAFWLATLILLGVYVIISFEWVHRTLAALLGAALILFISYTAGVLDEGYFILSFEDSMAAIDLNVIFLLFGMMIFVGVLKKTGVFQFMAYKSYAWARGNVFVLSFVLQFITAVLSAFLDNVTPKKNTVRAYGSLLARFAAYIPDRELDSISSEEVLSFLTSLNDSCKQLTKHTRYAYLKALFNFICNNLDNQLQNPCDTPMLKKLFRPGKLSPWQIHEKEVIDEIIFRTTKVSNRLMLELMARGGMRVGEVLKLSAMDIDDQKLTVKNPKSGKTAEARLHPQEAGRPLEGLPQGQRRCGQPENFSHHLHRRPCDGSVCLVWKALGKEWAFRFGAGLFVVSIAVAAFAAFSSWDWLVGFSLPSYAVAVGVSVYKILKSKVAGSLRKTFQKVGPQLVHLGVALVLLSFIVSSDMQVYPANLENISGVSGTQVDVGGSVDIGKYEVRLVEMYSRAESGTSGGMTIDEARVAEVLLLKSDKEIKSGIVLVNLYGRDQVGDRHVMKLSHMTNVT